MAWLICLSKVEITFCISDPWRSFSILIFTLVFPVGVLTLGTISPLEKIHFSIVSWISRSWISMSWFISNPLGSFSILVYTLVFLVGVLTLGNISPLEKIHFSLFLKSSGHDLTCDSRVLLARIVLSLMIPQTWWGVKRSLSCCSVLCPVSASHLQVHWCMCYNFPRRLNNAILWQVTIKIVNLKSVFSYLWILTGSH